MLSQFVFVLKIKIKCGGSAPRHTQVRNNELVGPPSPLREGVLLAPLIALQAFGPSSTRTSCDVTRLFLKRQPLVDCHRPTSSL
jgi:hypothetical protein